MTQNHGHEHSGGQHGRSTESRRNRGLHKDWRAWAVVILMLGAMAIYVLSDDESLRPAGAGPQAPVAADSPPPAP